MGQTKKFSARSPKPLTLHRNLSAIRHRVHEIVFKDGIDIARVRALTS